MIAKTLKYFLLLIFLVVVGKNMQAQQVHIIDADTVAAKTVNKEEFHSPQKASIYSAVLPGLGQAYNKKYWKVPLVYAGFGTIGYFAAWNNKYYNLFKTAYIHLNDDDPTTTDYLKIKGIEYYNLERESDRALLNRTFTSRQTYYRRNRDLLIISLFAFYAINIIDASVDAHLFNFDVSDDLSMNWQPSISTINNDLAYGINFSIKF